MGQTTTVTHEKRDWVALRKELVEFEERFGFPSNDMHKAFTENGTFIETSEYRRWNRLYVLTRRMAPSRSFA